MFLLRAPPLPAPIFSSTSRIHDERDRLDGRESDDDNHQIESAVSADSLCKLFALKRCLTYLGKRHADVLSVARDFSSLMF
mgnify:CR=1 FL=1